MQDTSSKPKGLTGALVAKAPELVNYQDGAVVSREIVKKPTGNVTLFAFDDDARLRFVREIRINPSLRRDEYCSL